MSTSADQPSTRQRFRRWVSLDVTSGALLMVAAVAAVVWANSPWRDAYDSLISTEFGPESLHLHLSLAEWAADGLLAIFFFIVGVELKQEFVAGSLRDLKLAGVPIVAAIGGMVVPALFYAAVVAIGDPEALRGWAIPTATDIAFALAVLAIFGRGLPLALRTFLLTLAVVDDLLGITVIATFYTETIDFVMFGAALAVIAVFGFLVRRRRPRWRGLIPIVLIPVAVVAWALMHASGVHATVAGVLLGFTVPALAVFGEKSSRTHQFDVAVRPTSSAVALPVFAFLSAGVTIVGESGIVQPVSIGIFVGLVVGKVVGVMGATAIMTRLTPLRLPDSIGVRDLLPIGMLTGVGFTVALLIAELSFEHGSDDHASAAKAAILVASLVAALGAAALLRLDARRQREPDMNRDGIDDRDIAVIE
ncbi:Na+/H+ antiporter NhaA [Gordonia insulae]|uniref:Na(+)/H(+) antiporter NhaA n=1 Tax=Gordonia insulae TaxID=2420509 RepID=A0A3G8JLY2_9ACTN|nr:Na+/H+ antiporter NhaA [Gordonia insulae]AZG45210.1 Na(+)/H(+) antiporter NhaA [Gordonia insulae]